MIDVSAEHIIPVLDVRKFLPVSIPTLRRWTTSGKLEIIRAGSKVLTSVEAIERMLRPGPQATPPTTLLTTPRQRKQDAKLDDALDRLRKKLGNF